MSKKLSSSQKSFAKKQKKRSKDCREKYKLNPTFCTWCNKKLPFSKRNNTFCNHSCSIKFNNTGKIKYRKNTDGSIIDFDNCKYCGTKLKRYDYKFCNKECRELFVYKQIEDYVTKTGKLPTTKHGGVIRAKKYLIKIYGHKCLVCNKKTWMVKPIPLIFDHIDGNRTNWNANNCRLICPNCDHQSSTFAGRNIKNKNESVRSKNRKNRYRILKKVQNFGERINY